MRTPWPRLVWLSVSSALVFALSGVGPLWPAQAAPLSPWRFNVISPRAPLCENNTYTYLVTVVSGVGRGPGFISHPGAWVDAQVLNGEVGFVAPARQSGLFSQDLSDVPETAPGQMAFTFYSKQAGTTTLKLTTTNNGQVVTANVPVTVEKCEVELTSISTWDIPGEAHLGLIASIHRAPMNADDQGHLTGTANVKWFLAAGRVGDCVGDVTLVNENVADLTGQVGADGQVTVNVFYQPAEVTLTDTCANAEGSITRDRTVLVDAAALTLTFPADGGTVTVSHALTAPDPVAGSAVVVVHPVTP